MAGKYPNSGIIGGNDRKEKDSHPDDKGHCELTCSCGKTTEYWISGWRKDGQYGPFISLSFKDKEDSGKPKPDNFKAADSKNPFKGQTTKRNDFDDDIPF